jgi:hypothetical protein
MGDGVQFKWLFSPVGVGLCSILYVPVPTKVKALEASLEGGAWLTLLRAHSGHSNDDKFCMHWPFSLGKFS